MQTPTTQSTRLMTYVAACILATAGISCGSQKPDWDGPLRVTGEHPLSKTPIIDIHTHTFNGSMLPLEGIALGKRDAFWLLTFMSDRNVRCLTDYISRAAYWADIDENMKPPEIDRRALAYVSESQGESIADLNKSPILKAIRHRYLTECGYGDEAAMVCDDPKKSRKALAKLGKDRLKTNDGEGFEQLLQTLLLSRSSVPQAYFDSFDEDQVHLRERHERGLIVSHSLDLAPVHNQRSSQHLLDYETEQIPAMAEQQLNQAGKMVYFVGYSPYRDHWPHEESNRTSGVEIVKRAINEFGAYGVKFYPPSGYRACGNVIPSDPFTLFTNFPDRQWEARYMQHPANDPDGELVILEGHELDQRTEKLLEYCIDEDIPVFTHSSTGEMEARKGYGIKNADPAYWEDFLKDHPTKEGKPCELRLCFGHAGGSAFWFGDSKNKKQIEWGETILRLCATYPNVYCEIGVHSEIGVDKFREVFIENVSSRMASTDQPFSFSTKLIYGTDWFMPSGMKLANYFDAYESAFLDDRLVGCYRNFFLNNALSYLNAEDRVSDDRLPEVVKDRLQELLDASDLKQK